MNRIIQLLFMIIVLQGCKSGEQQGSEFPSDEELLQTASEIVDVAFTQMSRELMGALEQGGVPLALEICHEQAIPITEEVATEFQVELKRTALKYRNPDNAPDTNELQLLMYYENMENSSAMQDTLVTLSDGAKIYARPILLQGPCLKCHGQPGTDIQEDDYQLLLSKYPQDQATGFAVGDFRGLWVVRFNQSHSTD